MSHENGGWMNSDQRDATKTHECFGFNESSTHCGQCGWPLKPGFRVGDEESQDQEKDFGEGD